MDENGLPNKLHGPITFNQGFLFSYLFMSLVNHLLYMITVHLFYDHKRIFKCPLNCLFHACLQTQNKSHHKTHLRCNTTILMIMMRKMKKKVSNYNIVQYGTHIYRVNEHRNLDKNEDHYKACTCNNFCHEIGTKHKGTSILVCVYMGGIYDADDTKKFSSVIVSRIWKRKCVFIRSSICSRLQEIES